MSWFSILPKSVQFIEIWAIRFFLVLGALIIGPWVLLVVYDAVLFLFRTITYDIPYIGGRARNRPRPRAPSLTERPSGRPRTISVVPGVHTAVESLREDVDGIRKRSEALGRGSDEYTR